MRKNKGPRRILAWALSVVMVLGMLPITAAAETPQEQSDLTLGETYYFNLSKENVPGKHYDIPLPDESLQWVPFTYAGTVNAYSLDESASGNINASINATPYDHRLFIADFNITHTVSWDELNTQGLIFGKTYKSWGVDYTLRSLSQGSSSNGESGSDERGIPLTNEWDQLLNKGNYIKNYSDIRSFGQDTKSGESHFRASRGGSNVRDWDECDHAGYYGPGNARGFRPTLEILNSNALGTDALKTVTYDMGGNGKLGSGSLKSATVVYTGTLTLPEITPENGFNVTKTGTGTLGWYDGTNFYAPGAALDMLTDGATLTAEFKSSSHIATVTPNNKTFTAATESYGEQTAQVFTIENTGTGDISGLTASLNDGSAFEISTALSGDGVAAGNTVILSVRPKTGLTVGDYTDTLTITGDNGIYLTVQLSFTVNVTLVSITAPTDITGVAYGTEKNASALGLPAKVTLMTNNGDVQADVDWDVAASAYSPLDTAAQTFTVAGTVTLPDGVSNPNSISLELNIDVTVDASTAPEEQFDLAVGETYYFDLSGANVLGTKNTALPDANLQWVPFTYAGTVNAYSLDENSIEDSDASDNATTSDRSLFVSNYVVTEMMTWDRLNNYNLVFGKGYESGDVDYTLRSLSQGGSSNYKYGIGSGNVRGLPETNEWDQIVNKGDYIKNCSTISSWGQDTSSYSWSRASRGGSYARNWIRRASSSSYGSVSSDGACGFRPALEILNSNALGTDALKTVTYDMGGNGKLGSGSLKSATVVYTGTLTLPEITPENGFNVTKTGTGTLGWYDGTNFYTPGAALDTLTDGATLTAGFNSSSYIATVTPNNKTFTAATESYGEQTAQVFTVKNTGTGDISGLTASLNDGSAFEISAALSGDGVAAGNTVILSVRPKTGLTVGDYTGTLTITGDNDIFLTASLSFTVNAAETYIAVIDPTGKTFTAATESYGEQTAQVFTIENTGIGDISGLTASLNDGSAFEISTALSGDGVAAGNTVILSVRPKTGLAVGDYTDTLTITGDNDIFLTASLSFTVNAAETYIAVIDPTGKTFTAATESYGEQTAQVFTIENTGIGDISGLTASLNDGSAFEISTALSGDGVAAGNTVILSARPKTGLAVGDYTDTLTITGDNDIFLTASLSFTVNAAETYIAVIDPTGKTFPEAAKGYGEQTAQVFTVKNTGTDGISGLSASLNDGSAFEISTALSSENIAAGNTVTLSVRPKTGLPIGVYTDILTITGDNGISLTVHLSFTVNVTLVSITAPTDITGVAYGTEKNASALGLPAKVTLMTNNGDVQADVDWDVAASAYSPLDTAAQTFTVAGTVTLPDGVSNPNSISLELNIDVTVDAWTAPEEQFTLTPGGICYFDLSGAGVPGTKNTDLPDASLKWVPFTYAGTVNAYSLQETANGDTSASANTAPSDRSLFVASFNTTNQVSWDDLNSKNFIFGKGYESGGVDYTLRSLSVGSRSNYVYGIESNNERGLPETNEWDQLLSKGPYIKNFGDNFSWGQDTCFVGSQYRAVRASDTVGRLWANSEAASRGDWVSFRPALEILNPGSPGPDALKTVTYDMGSNGTLGSGSLTSATVVYTGTLTLPEITTENGFNYTGGTGVGMLGWYDENGYFYQDGTALTNLPTGTILTVGYGVVNVNLERLEVNTGVLFPAFDTDTVAYSIDTADSLDSIKITATTAGPTMITIGGQTVQSGTPATISLDNGENLIPIVITSLDGLTQKAYIISVNGTVSDADLGSLLLSEGALSFYANTTEYYINVGSEVDSINLTAAASDSKAIMLLNGAILSQGSTTSIPLSVGDNQIELMVIAQDATTKTYTLTINRGNSDASLSGLSLSDGSLSPSFNAATYDYTATVANSVDSLIVTPTASDNAATVTVNEQSAGTAIELSVGDNTVTIEVTGSDGVTTKTYTITVTRQAEIEISNTSLPVGIIGASYSVTMTASGGTGSFTWSADGLPDSLSLDSETGVLSGTLADGDEDTYTVTITATDENEITGSETYTLLINQGCGGGAYLIVSDGDSAYTGSYTTDGIPILTVNDGVRGFTYFGVDISAVTGNDGKEVCLFVQKRNGEQIGFSFINADFDIVTGAGAAFNVRAGDVIEVYIVDALTNGSSDNPNVL